MNTIKVCSLRAYDSRFYAYQREGSLRSAQALLPIVLKPLEVQSVLDVGCAAGAWIFACRAFGIVDCLGIDGEYVDRKLLMIDEAMFSPLDVTTPFDLGREFDLVQCLEVGEHVPRRTCDTLVDNIVRHGRHVLFSAAVPGQGGMNHVNERPYGYWRDLFAARRYRLFDFVRPMVVGNQAIEPWYRYNMLFFAHDSVATDLPPEVAAARVADEAVIRDYAPTAYRLRRWAMRSLPEGAVSMMAGWKHRIVVRALRRRQESA